MFLEEFKNAIYEINELALAADVNIYLVGGVIRDELAGVKNNFKDLDFTVAGEASQIARSLADLTGAQLKVFAEFRTAKVIFEKDWCGLCEIDFVSTRKEVYSAPGKLPSVMPGSLSEDLARRDFSINTLAIKLSDLVGLSSKDALLDLRTLIIDRHGGLEDLDNKIIRVLHPQSFIDDPTRIFRAARYAARLQGSLEEHTATWLHEAVITEALSTISRQRAERELQIVLCEKDNIAALKLLSDWGVFKALGWLEKSEFDKFVELWRPILANYSGQYGFLSLAFKLSCVAITDISNRPSRAAQLLVSQKMQRAWSRDFVNLENGSIKKLTLDFLRWAACVPLYQSQHSILSAELSKRV